MLICWKYWWYSCPIFFTLVGLWLKKMKIVSLFDYLRMKLIWWCFSSSIAEVRDGRALGILPTSEWSHFSSTTVKASTTREGKEVAMESFIAVMCCM